MSAPPQADLVCFSHLKWEFVCQRPQHLMTRAVRTRRVFFFQEPGWTDPAWSDRRVPRLEIEVTPQGVVVARPMLPNGIAWDAFDPAMRALPDGLVAAYGISALMLWFCKPHALDYAGHVLGRTTVYDCMDELSAFHGADPALPARERTLMARDDLVFTGGRSPFEAKRAARGRVHCFPSGVEIGHFAPARGHWQSRQTRLRCRIRGPGSMAWWTSGWTWGCWQPSRICGRTCSSCCWGRWRRSIRRRCRNGEPALSGAEGVWRAAGLRRALGCGGDAVRAERGDAVHQPDQDACTTWSGSTRVWRG